MKILLSLGLVVLTAMACSADMAPKAFDTVGLYVWSDTPNQHAFWKACGINTLQLCDTGWSMRPDIREKYLAKQARGIRAQKKAGFKVYVIYFSNIAQWMGPEEREPSGIGIKFDPHNKAAMADYLKWVASSTRVLKEADGFTFFAGDPGGVPPNVGKADVHDWMAMAKEVQKVVKREAPKAEFNANPWAVTMWQYPESSAMTSSFWLRETELTKIIINDKDFIGPELGIEIPFHNYYRALALRSFAQDGITPELFPTVTDIKNLKAKGAKRIWAWPYFLLDEADDGDVGPDGQLLPVVQVETRYIHRLIKGIRKHNVNGVMGSWSYAGYLSKALNTYAFGRFCNDPSATPTKVIEEYAGFIATDDTKADLVQILRYVENQSNWQKKLPEGSRLPALKCSISTPDQAIAALDRVKVRTKSAFSLPEPARDYLKRIRERIDILVAREKAK
ncbi:MAG: hypothetical protein ACYC27_05385 [Armatimonadota bacterium]